MFFEYELNLLVENDVCVDACLNTNDIDDADIFDKRVCFYIAL